MNITSFYNHSHIQNEVRKGMAIVNATPKGNEVQQYNVGDVVQSTTCSTYNFKRAKVVEVYKENGYFRYVCKIGNFERIFRGKDIELL